jgi:hypothetical protein
MKRGLMEPDPQAVGISIVASLWLAALVMGLIVLLTAFAE